MNINELETTLLDQIEKLNDIPLDSTKEEIETIIDRSKAMSSLASNVIELTRAKIDAIKVCHDYLYPYEKFMGIPENKK